MADRDASLENLRYNLVSNQIEAFGGGSPMWSTLVILNPGGGATPGGSNTQVQFNDGGTAFGGSLKLTFNKTTGDLTLGDSQNLIFGNGGNALFKYDASNGNFYLQQSSASTSDVAQIVAPGDISLLCTGAGDFIPNFTLSHGGSAQLNAHGSVTFNNDASSFSLNSLGFVQVNKALKVGSGGPAASARVDVDSTTQGVVFPRMTTTQKNAISSPTEGLIVYDLTLHKLCVFTGSVWQTITSA